MKASLFYLASLVGATLAAQAAEPIQVPATAQNHVVKFTATAATTETAFGDYQAEDGHQLLVLTATWENVIDPTLAAQRNLPQRAVDDNFRESVTLLVDNRDALPALVLDAGTANIDPEDPELVGHSGGSTDSAYIRKVVGMKDHQGKRSLSHFDLDHPGDKTTGSLLFSIPARPWHSLELLYRDPLGGNFRLTLAGHPVAGSGPDPAGAQKNEVFVLAAAVAEDPAPTATPPPPGRRYVTVDFQGKSLLKVKDTLPPYDPTHETGAEFWRPDPAGWVEFQHGLQLVADGALPCGPEAASALPEAGYFSPEIWTHYRLVYLVPAAARSLDLVCYFATYTIPGVDGDVTPKPMHFHLAGPPAAAPVPPAKPEAKIVDGTLEFFVVHHATVDGFAGLSPAAGEKFLVVDYLLRNAGPESESFLAPEQLVRFDQDAPAAPDEASALGPYSAPAYFGLAPGESRKFQAMWRIPAGLKSAQMGLKGNFVAEKFTLPLATR